MSRYLTLLRALALAGVLILTGCAPKARGGQPEAAPILGPIATPTISSMGVIKDSTASIATLVEKYKTKEEIGMGEGIQCRPGEQAIVSINLANNSALDYAGVYVRFESDHEKSFFSGLLYDYTAPNANNASDYREEWLSSKAVYRRVDLRDFAFPGIRAGEAMVHHINLIPAMVGEWEADVTLSVTLADGRKVDLCSWKIRFLVLPVTK